MMLPWYCGMFILTMTLLWNVHAKSGQFMFSRIWSSGKYCWRF
uniref:Uncharacterized protein n=1 Tax=Aegilops tauschii subsp. strangulata TaxID=200361 RepID=A0A453QM56_AEGTS